MAKQKRNAVPTVMKIAQKAAAVEIVCLFSGNKSIHLELTVGPIPGFQACKQYEKVENSDLCEMLCKRMFEGQLGLHEVEQVLLELVRHVGKLKLNMFRSGHTYCIVCTCFEIAVDSYLFHLAGLIDTTEIIAERRDTQADDILRHTFHLIGSNSAYYDSRYDGDAFLQELKLNAGGPHTCNCGHCERTFVQVILRSNR